MGWYAAPSKALENFVKQHIALPLQPLCAAWQAATPTLASLVAALIETAELLAADDINAESGQLDRGRERCACGTMLMGRSRHGYWPI